MFYIAMCKDAPDGTEKRDAHREKHWEHIRAIAGCTLIAGPTLSEDGSGTAGSVFVLEAESREAVEAIIHKDPFYQAGIWQTVEITPAKFVTGKWHEDSE